MVTCCYERQDIIQFALKRLPGGDSLKIFFWLLRYSSEMPKFYKNYLLMRNTVDVTGGNPIAVCSLSISGVSAINPLVASYAELHTQYYSYTTCLLHNLSHRNLPMLKSAYKLYIKAKIKNSNKKNCLSCEEI
jgi:hypothetical protein